MAVAHAQLWQQYRQEQDAAVREQLILKYLWLVPYVAGRLSMGLPPRTEQRELESYGVFGLIDALERYDPGRGVRFETYAIPWVRGAILSGLRVNHWSPALVRRVKQLESATAALETKLGRTPTAAELAEHMGLTLRELAGRQREVGCLAVLSLDEGVAAADGDQEMALHERLPDPDAPDPETEVCTAERQRLLAEAITALPPRERRVVELYYYEGLTLNEVSKVLGVSPARVSQLHSKAIFRLRGRLGRLKAVLGA